MENEIRKQVIDLVREKLERLSIRDNEITGGFDLVKSGLVNSLEFVDMVASLEKLHGIEIDFEKELDKGDFTSIDGLIRIFSSK